MSLVTQETLKLEAQVDRCKAMIFEYFKGQCIRIDYQALFARLDPPALLFQFCHMIAFHKLNWKDALLWVVNHRDEVLAYSSGQIDEWGNKKVVPIEQT